MATILVVDDEPTIRDVVVRYLRREGYTTLEASDGNAARALLERESPSLIVLDLMLPGIDGLALCRDPHPLPRARDHAHCPRRGS